jgi:membrane peptidoglycan carboxypeptidase
MDSSATSVGRSGRTQVGVSSELPWRRIRGYTTRWVGRLRRLAVTRVGRLMIAGAIVGAMVLFEVQTSFVQSLLFTRWAKRISYVVAPGPDSSIRYPTAGPYDERLGYTSQSARIQLLLDQGFRTAAQARWSPAAVQSARAGVFATYQPKAQAGLTVLGRRDELIYHQRYPERVYHRFAEIPTAIVQALLFIENRELLENGHSRRNPAIEYDRMAKAVLDLGAALVNPNHAVSGGSTLATQLEKLRHSPGGRTESAAEKGRQLISASLRVYRQGEHTEAARQQIVVAYLNSMPLAAIAGYGEVTGLADGLWAWYGADFAQVNRLLSTDSPPGDDATLTRRAAAYRQVLSLLLAVKRPTTFLVRDGSALEARVDGYLRTLTSAGVIAPGLRDAALAARVDRRRAVFRPDPQFADRKAADSVRFELLSSMKLANAYALDRLDLKVRTTFDDGVQDEVTRVLQQLGKRAYAREAGLLAERLIGNDDTSRVLYSFSLYERTSLGNELRVQTDTFEGPLNLNEGSRLELGSTAKLRTLVTYLEIVEVLHREYGSRPRESLRAEQPHPRDRLRRWAIEHLTGARDRSLQGMLDAALERRYSANPNESFFTGGGVHQFRNFDRDDDRRVFTVREAFQRSVNLVFIRLMRDIVQHQVAGGGNAVALQDTASPERVRYLSRFADREGTEFLRRFYARHRNGSRNEALRNVAQAGSRRSLTQLAALFCALRPAATAQELAAFLAEFPVGSEVTTARAEALHKEYSSARWTLQDRGYLARVHPLELWLLSYLEKYPQADFPAVVEAGAAARQEAYAWLFRTANRRSQDRALRVVMEVEAFERIHAGWMRHGYPFGSLVASYATALGSSGDSPLALSELVGIVLNDGIRAPTVRLSQVHFGENTPYDTQLVRQPVNGERVLSMAVAAQLRGELNGVVAHGTGRRLAGGFSLPDGTVFRVGGKTGTGDNRFTTVGPRGRTSRVVNRTATFVFTIGDRFFGTIVAVVPGAAAATYDFTSALPVHLLKHLGPTLQPLWRSSAPGAESAN